MNIVLSPSNLKTYRDCPRKFQARYVTKELKFTQSPAAARGEQLHALMEAAVRTGWDSIQWPERGNREYARSFIQTIWNLKAAGWIVKAELEAATDGLGNVTGWWDKPPQNFMRSKIDVCATHPDKDHAIIIDWKTGRVYDSDLIQLAVNALCLYPITGKTKYQAMFAYLDSGTVKDASLEIDILHPATYELKENSPLRDVMLAIRGVKKAYDENQWPATKNRFCNWCEVQECPNK